jgi:hypothetical protein
LIFHCLSIFRKKYAFVAEKLLKFLPYAIAGIFLLSIQAILWGSVFLMSLCLAWPLVRSSLIGEQEQKTELIYAKNLWIVLLAYAYCGTNTAGYNYVSTDYLIAYLFSGLAYYFSLTYRGSVSNIARANTLVIIFIIVAGPKLGTDYGYNWWGMRSGGVLRSKSELPYPKLAGLYTDGFTAEIFREVKDANANLNRDDFFFAYPSIPIFYSLENKPPIGAPVLWV